MIVRDAVDTDLPALLAMAAEFYAASGYDRAGPFDAEHTTANIGLVRQAGVLLVADVAGFVVGMVGLVGGPGLCNPTRLAHEVCWWVRPEHRRGAAGIALLRAVEPAVKARGFIGYQMMHLENSPPGTGKLYERFGLAKTETAYTKIFEKEE